jgi:hypothetical protein
MPKTDVKVKLIGTDGNAFALIGKVCTGLKNAGQNELASEFRDKAFDCSSYDKLLCLISEYVEVK